MSEREPSHNERGIALVLVLLALLLLTALALHMAALTSTEVQLTANYRWSLKARYNAEAGIAVGRTVLKDLSWTYALPPARAARPPQGHEGAASPAQSALGQPSSGTLSRDYEMSECDRAGRGMGYGTVLFDGATSYQDVREPSGQPLDGAFTLWVRRPMVYGADATRQDYLHDDVLILTSEGVAPAANPSLAGRQASAVIEVTLYSSPRGVTIGPPYWSESWLDVIATTTPYKVGSAICR